MKVRSGVRAGDGMFKNHNVTRLRTRRAGTGSKR